MATYNDDGTTTYVPGESNARAVPPPTGKESDEVVHEGTPPSHVETRVGTAPGHVTAPKHPHAKG